MLKSDLQAAELAKVLVGGWESGRSMAQYGEMDANAGSVH